MNLFSHSDLGRVGEDRDLPRRLHPDDRAHRVHGADLAPARDLHGSARERAHDVGGEDATPSARSGSARSERAESRGRVAARRLGGPRSATPSCRRARPFRRLKRCLTPFDLKWCLTPHCKSSTSGSACRRGKSRAEWFRKDEEFDAEIRRRFGELHDAAARRELEAGARSPSRCWRSSSCSTSSRATSIRNDARAFAQDAHALECAREALARGDDARSLPVERQFLYLPFEHSEDRGGPGAVRASSCRSWRRSRRRAASPSGRMKHRAIIERFGRFPHRNAILGRASTPGGDRVPEAARTAGSRTTASSACAGGPAPSAAAGRLLVGARARLAEAAPEDLALESALVASAHRCPFVAKGPILLGLRRVPCPFRRAAALRRVIRGHPEELGRRLGALQRRRGDRSIRRCADRCSASRPSPAGPASTRSPRSR